MQNPERSEEQHFLDLVTADMPDKKKQNPKLPRNWVRLKKKGYDYVLVELSPESPEYLRVRNAFVTQRGPDTVEMIMQVQCPSLYKKYASTRESTQKGKKKAQNTEQTLYYGCKKEILETVCKIGFTSGTHQSTPYGKGTLFVKKAGFAAHKHSPRHSSGHKFLFQCQVLTSPPVLGHKNLEAPAKKENAHLTAVDNLLSPRMFVTFAEDQAYPEYLIVFK